MTSTCEVDCQRCCQHDVCCTPKNRPSWIITVPKELLLSSVNKKQNLRVKIVGLEKSHQCPNAGTGACKACRFGALCSQR